MSRKYCTKHPDRGQSNYPLRLARRGHHKTPLMESLSTLRKRQGAKELPQAASESYAGWDPSDIEQA